MISKLSKGFNSSYNLINTSENKIKCVESKEAVHNPVEVSAKAVKLPTFEESAELD